jgi:hypothetical protein
MAVIAWASPKPKIEKYMVLPFSQTVIEFSGQAQLIGEDPCQ